VSHGFWNVMQVNTPRESLVNEISFFFPAHNEEASIQPMVAAALEYLPTVVDDYEIIIVNDGSTDRTSEIAHALAAEHPEVRVVDHDTNRGYGGALISGIQAATRRWIFFTDGDQQFDIRELSSLIATLQPDIGAVIGYRIKRQDPRHRILNAYLYKSLIRLLFGLKVRDIDCAYKLVKTEDVQPLSLKSNGALISAEMLIRMKKRRIEIREVGVHHYPRTSGEQSGASIKVILRMFRELFKLAGELKSEERLAEATATDPRNSVSPKVL